MSLTNVPGHKSDHQLLSLGALTAGLGHHVLVEQLHGALKAGKLHHGVGDLPEPQWVHTLIEPARGSEKDRERGRERERERGSKREREIPD